MDDDAAFEDGARRRNEVGRVGIFGGGEAGAVIVADGEELARGWIGFKLRAVGGEEFFVG